MTERGIDFLENRVHKNVTGADRKCSMERAKELATFCIADVAGIVFWKTFAAIRERREKNENLH